jgi:hypothetical protein
MPVAGFGEGHTYPHSLDLKHPILVLTLLVLDCWVGTAVYVVALALAFLFNATVRLATRQDYPLLSTNRTTR